MRRGRKRRYDSGGDNRIITRLSLSSILLARRNPSTHWEHREWRPSHTRKLSCNSLPSRLFLLRGLRFSPPIFFRRVFGGDFLRRWRKTANGERGPELDRSQLRHPLSECSGPRFLHAIFAELRLQLSSSIWQGHRWGADWGISPTWHVKSRVDRI